MRTLLSLPNRRALGFDVPSLCWQARVVLLVLALWVHPLVAQETDSSGWARRMVDSMSVEQKAGQILLPRVGGGLLGRQDRELAALLDQAREGLIGGVVIFGGDALSATRTLGLLQDAARWPLLVGIDAEWGPGMRLDGSAVLPRAMAMGAADSSDLARAAGLLTARQARALGAQMVLAPVVDLAIDPGGLIGTRAFGSDPQRVGRLATAFFEGVEEGGALAVAKHFPGHGAVRGDSHVVLPILDVDAELMARRELVPFEIVARAGIAGVMPGHLLVPAIDPEAPASRSRRLIEGLLREELGFDGLVVSDALDMSGTRTGLWDGAVAVESLAAGNDLLLLPPNPTVARDAIVKAVQNGRLPERRLEEAVLRSLEARARAGFGVELKGAPAASGSSALTEELRNGEGERLALEIAQGAVTLIEDSRALLPLSSRQPPRVLVVDVLPRGRPRSSSERLSTELGKRARSVERLVVSPNESSRKLETLGTGTEVDVVVVASSIGHAQWSSEDASGVSLAQEVATALERLPGRPPVVMASLRDPWQLSQSASGWSLVTSYDSSDASQHALAQALFGEIPWRGTLPVSVAEWTVGHGLRSEALLPRLETASAESVGMSSDRLRDAKAILERAVADGVTPGVSALVGRRGRIVFNEAVGTLSYDRDSSSVSQSTIFDLASLTKVVVTTTLTMMLVERGALDLEEPAARYLEGFTGGGRETVEIRDLLAHSSGVLWWTDLYLRYADLEPSAAKEAALKEIMSLDLVDPPRTKTTYSDLGILMLGEIIERVSGVSLKQLAEEWIFAPLEMRRTYYRPSPSLRSEIAPTEFDPWRGRVVLGEVHDENAHALGGVAPHAGLFSTTGDLARFAQMLLNGGYYDGRRVLNGATVESFTRPAALVEDSSRALGWDTPSGRSSSGRYFSSESYGHTGFTGTSLWIDPRRDLFVVLLTNRVHPTRDNRAIRDLRPAFHDAVMQAIVDEPVTARPGS